MEWPLLVLIGAPLNAFVNLGFKVLSASASVFVFTAFICAVASVALMLYGYWSTKRLPQQVLTKGMLMAVPLLAVTGALVMILFIGAFQRGGPVSLVDPLMACVYSLASLAVGIWALGEKPNLRGYMGIGLYILGAMLMAAG